MRRRVICDRMVVKLRGMCLGWRSAMLRGGESYEANRKMYVGCCEDEGNMPRRVICDVKGEGWN